MKNRKKIIIWMFEKSQKIYTNYIKKNEPWGINKSDLLRYPDESFGKHMGDFLEENGFDLIPKAERHDAYHVLTGYDTKVEDEIAQQYLCYGNGKRSIYLYGVITIGTLILPDYLSYYLKSYKIGKSANLFHNLDYKSLLNTSLLNLQSCIFSKSHINNYLKN
jgi:ubiquinone biosynthesis protein Coq4